MQSDLRRRVEATVRQLQAQGIDMEQWLSATGQDANAFVEGMKGQSEQAVKVDLALRAVAAAEGIEADDGDLAAEYERIAVQVTRSRQPGPQGLRAQRPGAPSWSPRSASRRRSTGCSTTSRWSTPRATPSTATSCSATTTTPTTTTTTTRPDTTTRQRIPTRRSETAT